MEIRSTGGSVSSLIRNLIGSYSPTGDGFGSADWEYIISGIILIVIFIFMLRILNSLFKFK